jgi:hypothetical protein
MIPESVFFLLNRAVKSTSEPRQGGTNVEKNYQKLMNKKANNTRKNEAKSHDRNLISP